MRPRFLRWTVQDVGQPVDHGVDLLAGRITLASNRAWDPRAIFGHMAHDKKTVGGRVHFVLLRGLGAPFVDGTVSEDVVLEVLGGECTPPG